MPIIVTPWRAVKEALYRENGPECVAVENDPDPTGEDGLPSEYPGCIRVDVVDVVIMEIEFPDEETLHRPGIHEKAAVGFSLGGGLPRENMLRE
jgi:hypothetical protein